MIIRYLTGYKKDLIRDVSLIKNAGVKCIDLQTRPLVETATGKVVDELYEVTFTGNFFKCLKAQRIMEKLHK